MNRKLLKKWTRIVLLFISPVFLMAIVLLTFIDLSERSGCTETVSAVVVDIQSKTSTRKNRTFRHGRSRPAGTTSSTGYAPVFEYTYNGVEYSSSNDHYDTKPVFEIGQETEILINPDDPTSVYAPEDDSLKNLRLVFLIIWIAYIIVVIVILPEIVFRKRDPES